MLATKIEQKKNEEGFTLIELLVVVIIIGILAAIAIPTFLSQRERGWQAELTSTVRNVALEIEAAATANNGSYVGIAPRVTAADGFAFQIQGATNTPVVFTVDADDFVANDFVICAQHVSIDGPHSISYSPQLGGLQDFDAASGC